MKAYHNGAKRRGFSVFGLILVGLILLLGSGLAIQIAVQPQRKPQTTTDPVESEAQAIARSAGVSLDAAETYLARTRRDKTERERTQAALKRLEGAICSKEPWRSDC